MKVLPLLFLFAWSAQAQTFRKTQLHHADLRRTPQDQYLLEVDLRGLNASALAAIRAQTGHGPAQPIPGRAYTLLDFLPPFMQATVGKNLPLVHHYEPVNRAVADELFTFPDWQYAADGRLDMHSFANCWGTAWEASRLLNAATTDKLTFTAFWYGRYDAEETLENAAYSDAAAGARRFGDVVLYKQERSGMAELMHASVVVGTFAGKEVHFEKIDSTDGSPYRLSFGDDIRAKYEAVSRDGGGKLLTLVRRFNGPGKRPLPSPRELVITANNSMPQARIRAMFPRTGLNIARLTIVACGDKMMGGCDPYPVLLQDYKLAVDPTSGRYIPDPNWANSARLVPAE